MEHDKSNEILKLCSEYLKALFISAKVLFDLISHILMFAFTHFFFLAKLLFFNV